MEFVLRLFFELIAGIVHAVVTAVFPMPTSRRPERWRPLAVSLALLALFGAVAVVAIATAG
jgi:hypothetical protein